MVASAAAWLIGVSSSSPSRGDVVVFVVVVVVVVPLFAAETGDTANPLTPSAAARAAAAWACTNGATTSSTEVVRGRGAAAATVVAVDLLRFGIRFGITADAATPLVDFGSVVDLGIGAAVTAALSQSSGASLSSAFSNSVCNVSSFLRSFSPLSFSFFAFFSVLSFVSFFAFIFFDGIPSGGVPSSTLTALAAEPASATAFSVSSRPLSHASSAVTDWARGEDRARKEEDCTVVCGDGNGLPADRVPAFAVVVGRRSSPPSGARGRLEEASPLGRLNCDCLVCEL